jgi:hypothetical protein
MYDKSHLRTARVYQQFVRIPLKLALAHHWLSVCVMRGAALPAAIARAILLYKKLLPLLPFAISRLKVDSNVKFLISSDASVIKGLQCLEVFLMFAIASRLRDFFGILLVSTSAAPRQEMPSDASSFEP